MLRDGKDWHRRRGCKWRMRVRIKVHWQIGVCGEPRTEIAEERVPEHWQSRVCGWRGRAQGWNGREGYRSGLRALTGNCSQIKMIQASLSMEKYCIKSNY